MVSHSVVCSLILVCVISYVNSLSVRMMSSSPLKGKALIIQNKGGGHGTIGYYLAKNLKTENPQLDVTILQDKCNYKKAPFSSYKDDLQSIGVTVIDTVLTGDNAVSTIPTDVCNLGDINYIIDNWSKNTQNSTYVIDIAKQSKAEQVLFVSSAGMYKTTGVTPIVETDAVKGTNEAKKIEDSIVSSGLPYTFLRPQYVYGEKSNKRYLDFFIGRAHRDLITPLPMHGEQLVCLTHVEDVATMIACALGNKNANNQVFNCGTDKYISYKALSQLIHKKLGKDASTAKYMYYEPNDFNNWDGSGVMQFPFRRDTFITTPSKAKLLLGWKPKHNLEDDLDVDIREYADAGGFTDKWSMKEVKYDLEIIASKDSTFTFTYPFFDDESINDEPFPAFQRSA